MRSGPSRSGFVLLLVLVLVVLAATLLAGLARRSAAAALESQTATEELQRRWAVASCRATLLGRVERILDEAERRAAADRDADASAQGSKPTAEQGDGASADSYQPTAELRVACQLSGMDYELVLTDEQAKLDVNGLLRWATRGEAQSIIERLIETTKGGPVASAAVHLRPVAVGVNSPGAVKALLPLGGFGQVFENVTPDGLAGGGLATALTCWGDGKVNLRRAPAEVLRQACERPLGRDVVAALLAARARDPYRDLAAMVRGLDQVDKSARAKVTDFVTVQSTCHGLWVIAHGPQRSWHTLAIETSGEGAGPAASHQVAGVRHQYFFAW